MENENKEQDKFEELWLYKLSKKQRKERILRAFAPIRTMAQKQLDFLKKYEKSDKKKDISFMYYYNTLASVWDNIDFAIALGKGKYQKFAFYPTRNVLENGFRLEYFTNQSKEKRKEIAVMEFLRVIHRSYEHDKSKGRDVKEYEENYRHFSSLAGSHPKIDEFKEKGSDPFPSMWKLIKNTKMEGGLDWYHHYQSLCEVTHGKLFGTIMSSSYELDEHVWCLQYSQFMAIYLLKLSAFHINGSVTKEVANIIKKAEEIIKKDLNEKGDKK
jgi:hypothetical protein